MPVRERVRAFCIASMVGTACSWTVFAALMLTVPDSNSMYRLWLALVSTVLGGAAAGCISRSVRSFVSLVISCCIAVQLYNPGLGSAGIAPSHVFTSAVVASFIAAYFGHTLPATLIRFKE